MPRTPLTPASRLLARSLRLSSRLQRRGRPPRAQLASRVAERRQPHVARIARRLLGSPPAAVREPIPVPEGMSGFAARWMFGDGRAEGTPLSDSSARAALARVVGPPSFQPPHPEPAGDALAWPADSPSSATIARTPVEEFGARRARGFRLATAPAAEASTGAHAPPSPQPVAVTPPAEEPRSRPVETLSAPPQGAPPVAPPDVTAAPSARVSTPAAPRAHDVARVPVRAVVARSAGSAALPKPRRAPAPLRVAAAHRRTAGGAAVPAAPPHAPAPQPTLRAARPGLLHRALSAAGGVLTRRRAPVAPTSPSPVAPATPHAPSTRAPAAIARAAAAAPQPVASPATAGGDLPPEAEDAPEVAAPAGQVPSVAAGDSPPASAPPLLARRARDETAPATAAASEPRRDADEPPADRPSAVEPSTRLAPSADTTDPGVATPPDALAGDSSSAAPAPTRVFSASARRAAGVPPPHAPARPATPARDVPADPEASAPAAGADAVAGDAGPPPSWGAMPAGLGAAPAPRFAPSTASPSVPRAQESLRPLLRAERRVRRTTEAAFRSAPGSSGARLARALGLPLAPQADGSVSLSLDDGTSAAAVAVQAPVLARAPEAAAGGSATGPPSTPAAIPAASAPAAAGPPATSLEDTYEYVVERLRRDLLVERERMGDLIGRLP